MKRNRGVRFLQPGAYLRCGELHGAGIPPGRRQAIGQINLPALDAIVDVHYDLGVAGRQLGRFAESDRAGADGVQVVNLIACHKFQSNAGRTTVTGGV